MLPVATELVKRLGWLIRLRWLAVLAVACAIEVGGRALALTLPRGPLYTILAALAAYNLLLFLVHRNLPPPGAGTDIGRTSWLARLLVPRTFWGLGLEGDVLQAARFAMLQIGLDLVFLALLLHYSGGIENPLSYAYVFHIIVASILLSRRATYAVASVGLLLVSVVGLGECWGLLAHHHLGGPWSGAAYRSPALVAGHLAILGATLFFSGYICSTIAVNLRQRERDIVLLSRDLQGKADDLIQAYEALSRTEEAKSRYMRKVAHELRGPLGTIQTALRTVLSGRAGADPAVSRDLIGRAERRAAELSAVTGDLLELSRARDARIAQTRTSVDLAQLARDVATDAAAAAREAGITLDLELAPGIGAQEGDPVALRQLLANLLGNAVRYTPRGGRIWLRARKDGTILRLEVQDTGIGIQAEDLPRIFDEFFRAKNAREHAENGTGLGLAIVKAVAERHGGTVSVESVPGQGSRFMVGLPEVSGP